MHEPIRRLVLSSEYRAYVQACWIWWFTEAVHRRLISLIYGFYWTIQSSSSFDGELIVSRVCFVGWEMDDERQNNIERREADQTHNWNSFSIVVLVLQSIKWNTHAREGRRNRSIELRARVWTMRHDPNYKQITAYESRVNGKENEVPVFVRMPKVQVHIIKWECCVNNCSVLTISRWKKFSGLWGDEDISSPVFISIDRRERGTERERERLHRPPSRPWTSSFVLHLFSVSCYLISRIRRAHGHSHKSHLDVRCW